VLVCAYTDDRWELTLGAVRSLLRQTVPPQQIIVCVDHNPELAARLRLHFAEGDGRVEVATNRFAGRLGSARNTGLLMCDADLLAFLDDDAEAPPDWVERQLAAFHRSPDAALVGGAPHPRYEVPRPGWIPVQFDWVFGCVYDGLPERPAPVRHVIGASMCVRLDAALAVGGFHSDDHDDMDLCHRLHARFGPASVLFDPGVTVSHFVSANRLTWAYYWRRIYRVNRSKVVALRDMGAAGDLRAELKFVLRTSLIAVPRSVAVGIGRRDGQQIRRGAAAVAGMALAGAGHLRGRLDVALGRHEQSRTRGVESVLAVADPGRSRSA
jgi:GT2 family glycosyltransferase